MNNDLAATQIEILQARIGLHGSRMWQLPLTYLGAIAVFLTTGSEVAAGDSSAIPFMALSVLGILLLWCLFGAYEGYKRTADHLMALEVELELKQCTRCPKSHVLPYFTLILFGIVCCSSIGVFYLVQ